MTNRRSRLGWLLSAQALAVVVTVAVPLASASAQTYGTDNRECDRTSLSNVFSTSTNNIVGSAVGGAAGGLLGSQFGKGSGNTVMTIAGVLGGALAGGTVGRSMEPVDHGCINQALEHTPSGQSVAWQNPDNHASYWVTPTKTYQQAGKPCRHYTTTALIDGRSQRLHGTACRQEDGAWRQQ
ncbi:MAG TPA: RT0821/Lpp0805 family surface protein [Stellaceae bacterium]|nr:RT0821/Lpp0805 family surface protein [Stellaceae bacterium]